MKPALPPGPTVTLCVVGLSETLLLGHAEASTGAGEIASIIGAVAALLAISAAVRGYYRRTLGRRRERYRRLARLGTGAQLSFFESVLREPPAMRWTITSEARDVVYADDPRFDPALADFDNPVQEVVEERSYIECFFVDRDYYVQTISDADETVLSFSVTTRSKRFRPTFEMPYGMTWRARRRWRKAAGERYEPFQRVTLGRTRFSDLDPDDPEDFAGPHFKIRVGARVFFYDEFHSYGNPGHYQTFVFSASVAAGPAPFGDIVAARAEVGSEEWPNPTDDDDPRSWKDFPVTAQFRRDTAITTYTVIGPAMTFAVENYPSTFGPHGDEVRTLPRPVLLDGLLRLAWTGRARISRTAVASAERSLHVGRTSVIRQAGVISPPLARRCSRLLASACAAR